MWWPPEYQFIRRLTLSFQFTPVEFLTQLLPVLAVLSGQSTAIEGKISESRPGPLFALYPSRHLNIRRNIMFSRIED